LWSGYIGVHQRRHYAARAAKGKGKVKSNKSKSRRRSKLSKDEHKRRLRLGDLHKLFRDRCGSVLPDSWEGRRYLKELLLPLSLWPNEARHRPGGVIGIWGPTDKMRREIELRTPWMQEDEIEEVIDEVEQMPEWQRKPLGKTLGRRLNLTFAERDRLKIKTIRAYDISEKALAVIRRQRKRQCDRQRRLKRGARPQADSISRLKPWVKEGISRATWYRRINQEQARETTSRQVNLSITELEVVSSSREVLSTNAGSCVRPSTATPAGLTGTCVTAGSSRWEAA
jgi:hypothetical protein